MTVHLEFRLPSGAAGMAAGMTRQGIGKRLRALSEQHGFNYTSCSHGYRYYVTVDDRTYTLLSLLWKAENPWHKFTVVAELPPGST